MPDTRRCVFGCVTNGIVLHNFPNPTKFPERFQLWVDLVGEPVENLPPSEIYKKKKLCDLHFTEDDRNRNNRLNAIATPVPFPYQRPTKGHWRHTSSTPLLTQTAIQRHWRLHTSSTPLLTQTELFQDPDLDPDEECPAICKEQVEEGIVPVAKTFTWEKQNEAVCIKADNDSLYLDDKEPTSPPQDIKYKDTSLHEGFQCDVCKGEIRGFRYTCVQCIDFDLCSSCEMNRAHHHHYVLRVPQYRPYVEIQLALATIRRLLMKKLDALTEFDQDFSDNLSIKSEIKSECEKDEMDDEIPSQDWSHSTDKSTPQKQTDHNEQHIEMNLPEGTQTNMQVEEQNNTPSSQSTPVIHSQQQNQPFSKLKPPIILSNAKKKILIKLNDFIKVKDGLPSAKKIRVLPITKNKSDDKMEKVLIHNTQFKAVSKMMVVKLPGALLKDAHRVPIQKMQLSTTMKHSANVDNG